ncbi:MAG: hypothetical protein FWE44_07120 [Defluviitaleaceae bacterium]|nr:hypothetical protein [Defluviitaleaceae bacterium]
MCFWVRSAAFKTNSRLIIITKFLRFRRNSRSISLFWRCWSASKIPFRTAALMTTYNTAMPNAYQNIPIKNIMPSSF